jgi:hypothetical protein
MLQVLVLVLALLLLLLLLVRGWLQSCRLLLLLGGLRRAMSAVLLRGGRWRCMLLLCVPEIVTKCALSLSCPLLKGIMQGNASSAAVVGTEIVGRCAGYGRATLALIRRTALSKPPLSCKWPQEDISQVSTPMRPPINRTRGNMAGCAVSSGGASGSTCVCGYKLLRLGLQTVGTLCRLSEGIVRCWALDGSPLAPSSAVQRLSGSAGRQACCTHRHQDSKRTVRISSCSQTCPAWQLCFAAFAASRHILVYALLASSGGANSYLKCTTAACGKEAACGKADCRHMLLYWPGCCCSSSVAAARCDLQGFALRAVPNTASPSARRAAATPPFDWRPALC